MMDCGADCGVYSRFMSGNGAINSAVAVQNASGWRESISAAGI
jgi:hypothetical protein